MPLPVTVRVTCPVGTGVVPVAGATVITAAAPLTVGLFTVIVVFEAASGAPTPVALTPIGELAASLCTSTCPLSGPWSPGPGANVTVIAQMALIDTGAPIQF